MMYADRQKIQAMWEDRCSPKDIAAALGVHLPTLYIELKRGENGEYDKNYRCAYDAALPQRNYHESLNRRRPRAC